MPQSHTPWDGAERRRTEATTTEPILSHIDKRFDDMETLIRSGFPGGDIEGHRRDHETRMKSAEKWEKRWDTVVEKTLSGGVWAGAILLGTILWNAFKDRIKE